MYNNDRNSCSETRAICHSENLRRRERITLNIADESGKTCKKGVYAGGGVVTGVATVIEAMGAGRIAAKSIHEYIMNNKL